MHTLASEAYSSLGAPPYSAQSGPAPTDNLLFWNVYIVSCVFRQADIGPPIIGWSVVREKSLFIGPLSSACVPLALETFLTCCATRLIFVYVPKQQNDGGHRRERGGEREFLEYLTYTSCKEFRFVWTLCLPPWPIYRLLNCMWCGCHASKEWLTSTASMAHAVIFSSVKCHWVYLSVPKKVLEKWKKEWHASSYSGSVLST